MVIDTIWKRELLELQLIKMTEYVRSLSDEDIEKMDSDGLMLGNQTMLSSSPKLEIMSLDLRVKIRTLE